jgi:hypothetical protein
LVAPKRGGKRISWLGLRRFLLGGLNEIMHGVRDEDKTQPNILQDETDDPKRDADKADAYKQGERKQEGDCGLDHLLKPSE